MIRILFALMISKGYSQKNFSSVEKLNFDHNHKDMILSTLDTLLSQVKIGNIDNELIYKEDQLTKRELESLKGYDTFEKKLLNLYPLTDNKFSLTIAFFNLSKNLICLYTLTCIDENQAIKFYNSLYENTNNWKKEIIGNITYYYKSKIDKVNATNFNAKNEQIAKKLGVPVEKFNFYLTDNYQQILCLLGYQYDAGENGKYRDGYGVIENNIFAIQGNEDFSHDIFHYYSGKTNKTRNRISEEGIAYLWGNAYYTDSNKKMIPLSELVLELKKYMAAHPEQALLELFEKDMKVFDTIAKEISVRSVISGILIKEIEKKNGMTGISKMITCGEKMQEFMAELDLQLKINKENFNAEVTKLIQAYN